MSDGHTFCPPHVLGSKGLYVGQSCDLLPYHGIYCKSMVWPSTVACQNGLRVFTIPSKYSLYDCSLSGARLEGHNTLQVPPVVAALSPGTRLEGLQDS